MPDNCSTNIFFNLENVTYESLTTYVALLHGKYLYMYRVKKPR